ncbi:MAG: twin-arginine translocation signal domain-containing protein [Planctomycetes bacterium]|nr:twin-arginine translocation signal domain-containing protein [Planctomycetota bacterium]
MNTSRRDVLRYTAAAGALGASGLVLGCASTKAHRSKPLDILILGGTGFLGPAIVEAAKPRGHKLTLFNRGKTKPGLFPELEKLQGDRDPKKGEGLEALEGRKFDVVFDDCGYYPRMVAASAELLKKNGSGHYVYISSISCYAENDKVGLDETARLATMDDPTLETMGDQFQHYGPLKALCEQAAATSFGEATTIVRPGYIVGPGDWTHRFTYWPARVAKGGEMVAPGNPSDPIQIIDVRDLAEWLVRLAEERTYGTFNACGPANKLSMGEVLDACKANSKNDVRFTWIDADFLAKQGVGLPIWAPSTGESAGFHTWSNARAVKAGLKFRPVGTIAKDALAWFVEQPEDVQQKLWAQLSPEAEAKLLEAWHAEHTG